jgi:hypothetical protein
MSWKIYQMAPVTILLTEDETLLLIDFEQG